MTTSLPFCIISFSDTLTLTNSPLAEREILNQTSWRFKIDLDCFITFRIVLNVQTAGVVNGKILFEGSPDNGSSWYKMDGSAGPTIALNPTGAKDTGWKPLNPLLRVTNVLLRMKEKDGDGVADPILRQILIALK